MKITINEVAKEAGVSITTVSRVINNNYPVKKETKERIEKAIEKLSYTPNIMARSLITKKTSMIGIIVPGITNLFFPTIVEAIDETIKANGYSITLCNTGGDAENEKNLIEDMIARQVDGIIAIDPSIENMKSLFYERISEIKPTIIVNGSPNACKCNYVCYDEENGTKEAFKYLLQLGHKKIAFVRGYKSLSYDIKEKIYKDIVKENKFDYEKILNVGKGNTIEVVQNSEKILRDIIGSSECPTAIFACNDLMAVGAINTCREFNKKIPEEISVISFDNTLVANITNPRLTSVDQNMKAIGNKAAYELIDLIDNKTKIRKRIILDTTLVIRESCSQCRS